MSHGQRMLEAQAQRDRLSVRRDDGTVDDGHLRNGSRALEDDATPKRPSRNEARHSLSAETIHPPFYISDDADDVAGLTPRPSRPRTEADQDDEVELLLQHRQRHTAPPVDLLLASPPPRPTPETLWVEDDRVAASEGGTHGSTAGPAPQLYIHCRTEKSRSERRRQRDGDEAGSGACHRRGGTHRRGGSASRGNASGAARYPAERIALSPGATSPAKTLSRSGEETAASHPLGTAADSDASVPRTAAARAPPPPITAFVHGAADGRAGGHSSSCRPPLREKPTIGGATLALAGRAGWDTTHPTRSSLPPPSSPPLRAAVSPRTQPLHLTRVDSAASLSRAASYGDGTARTPNASSYSATASPSTLASQPLSSRRGGSAAANLQSPPDVVATHAFSIEAELRSSVVDTGEEELGRSRGAQQQQQTHAHLHANATRSPPLSCASPADAAVLRRGSPSTGHRVQSPIPPPPDHAAPVSPLTLNGDGSAASLSLPPPATHLPPSQAQPPTAEALDDECPFLADTSGFHNNGNDCYACSALTMLLRCPVYRAALVRSPLATALRRFESLQSGRAERPVQTSSGYIARREAAQVGGAEEAVLQSFSMEELAAVLGVEGAATRAKPTLHGALILLLREQRTRERLTRVVNAATTPQRERLRLLSERVAMDDAAEEAGLVYQSGIGIDNLVPFFDDFFLDTQEDVHEFYVALLAQLETEAVAFDRRCNSVLDQREQPAPFRHRSEFAATTPLEAIEADSCRNDSMTENQSTWKALPPAPCALLPSPSAFSTAAGDVWINRLMQARLLNIIRCRRPDCHHEIVMEELCVNLSLHLPSSPPPPSTPPPPQPPFGSPVKGEATAATMSSSASLRSDAYLTCDGADDIDPYNGPYEKGGARNGAAASAFPTTPPPPVWTVAQLLSHSMAYEALTDYICDACQSKEGQYQGGCFYGSPPPVLVLQLKRFAVHFEKGGAYVSKNSALVAVDEVLEICALPTAREVAAYLGSHPSLADGVAVEVGKMEREEGGCSYYYYNSEEKRLASCLCESSLSDGASEEPLVWAVHTRYQLRSTIQHWGSNLHYGHYVSSFAVDGEDSAVALQKRRAEEEEKKERQARQSCLGGSGGRRWRLANDANVSVLSGTAVEAQRMGCAWAYLLLYEKVAEAWLPTPKSKVLPKEKVPQW